MQSEKYFVSMSRLHRAPSIASNKNIFQSSHGTRVKAIKINLRWRNLCKMMWAASPISHLNFLRHHRVTWFEFVQRKASFEREIITRSNWQFSYLCIKYEFEMMRRHGKQILPSFHHFWGFTLNLLLLDFLSSQDIDLNFFFRWETMDVQHKKAVMEVEN